MQVSEEYPNNADSMHAAKFPDWFKSQVCKLIWKFSLISFGHICLFNARTCIVYTLFNSLFELVIDSS